MVKARRLRLIRALFPCLTALCAVACSSTDLVVGAPTPAKCQVAVDNSLPTAPAAGATGTLTVATTPECEWDATTPTSWIAITSPSHSQGSGAVTYRVAENADASARGGTVLINSTEVAISQVAGACRFAVAPLASSVAATGGRVEVNVDAHGTCVWEAASQASWIRVGSSASHTGPGPVTLTIDPNAGGARSGSVAIAGQTMTVTQAAAPGPPCAFSVAPLQVPVAAAAGSASVTVTAGSGCTWTATENASWLTIVSGASGSGNGTVTFAVTANSTSSPRTDTVTVAGQTVTVTQAGASAACSYGISPRTATSRKGGDAIRVNVLTEPGCAWTSRANAAWLSIAAGASGVGSGVVRVEVDKLTGAPKERVGTVTVAGQTLTVTQEK